jgi:anti-anti-sigma regulatory factor
LAGNGVARPHDEPGPVPGRHRLGAIIGLDPTEIIGELAWAAASAPLLIDRGETMGFAASARSECCGVVRLDLCGELRGAAVVRLRFALVELIAVARPDELLVNLARLASLDVTGAGALMSGYVIAIDYGTSYRVVNVPDQVHPVLQDLGLLEILTGSDDIGTLLLALLTCPATPRSSDPGGQ